MSVPADLPVGRPEGLLVEAVGAKAGPPGVLQSVEHSRGHQLLSSGQVLRRQINHSPLRFQGFLQENQRKDVDTPSVQPPSKFSGGLSKKTCAGQEPCE